MTENKIHLQETGFAPFYATGSELARRSEVLDGNKRGILLAIYRTTDGELLGELTYTTDWKQERPFTRVMRAASLDELGQAIRLAAKTILPPGAGYPATDDYRERQAKLMGQLEVLTLSALSECLRQISAA
jgi:hypothetical protein